MQGHPTGAGSGGGRCGRVLHAPSRASVGGGRLARTLERRGDAVTLQSGLARSAVSQPALRGGIFLAAGARRTQGWCKRSRGRPLLPPRRSAPQTCLFPSQRGWLRTRWASSLPSSSLRSGAGAHSPPSLLRLLFLSRAQVPVTKGTSQSWWPLDRESRAESFLDASQDQERLGWRQERRGCDDGEKLRSPELSSLVPSLDYHDHQGSQTLLFTTSGHPGLLPSPRSETTQWGTHL